MAAIFPTHVFVSEMIVWLLLNSSQIKIKYVFSKPFPCDSWYVKQNMIIHDILTRPFSETFKILNKSRW